MLLERENFHAKVQASLQRQASIPTSGLVCREVKPANQSPPELDDVMKEKELAQSDLGTYFFPSVSPPRVFTRKRTIGPEIMYQIFQILRERISLLIS